MLVENCIELNDKFDEIYDDCIFLNPFATLYRYSEGDLMLDKDAVVKVIFVSKKIFNFIKKFF